MCPSSWLQYLKGRYHALDLRSSTDNFSQFFKGPNIGYNIWNDEDSRRGQRRMYRMEGRAQIHCDTEARSNMSNYALAAQWHQCCYLTRNSPYFSVAQRLGEKHAHFNAILNAAIPAVNVRDSSLHSTSSVSQHCNPLSFLQEKGRCSYHIARKDTN